MLLEYVFHLLKLDLIISESSLKVYQQPTQNVGYNERELFMLLGDSFDQNKSTDRLLPQNGDKE